METRVRSSSSIEVKWQALEQSAQTDQTSSLTGYVIFFKEESSENYQQMAVQKDIVTTVLKDLKKFTLYQISVSPYSSNGNGVPSQPVENKTLEDGE